MEALRKGQCARDLEASHTKQAVSSAQGEPPVGQTCIGVGFLWLLKNSHLLDLEVQVKVLERQESIPHSSYGQAFWSRTAWFLPSSTMAV